MSYNESTSTLRELANSGQDESLLKDQLIPAIKSGKPIPKSTSEYCDGLKKYAEYLKNRRMYPDFKPSSLETKIQKVLSAYKSACIAQENNTTHTKNANSG